MNPLRGKVIALVGGFTEPRDALAAALRDLGAEVLDATVPRCDLAVVGEGADADALRAESLGVPTTGAQGLAALLGGERLDALLGAPPAAPARPPMPEARPYATPRPRRPPRPTESTPIPLRRRLSREVVVRDPLGDDALEALARRVTAATDGVSRDELVRSAAPGVGAGSVWLQLWRRGQVDLPRMPAHWEALAFVAHALDAGELMRFLARYAPGDSLWGAMLPRWPACVDRIAMEVYLRDPWDRAPSDLSDDARRGLAWVRARAGDRVWKPSARVDRWLAARTLDGDLGGEAHAFEGGEVVGLRITDRGAHTEHWAGFVASLTTPERLAEALAAECVGRARRGSEVPWSRARDGLSRVPDEALTALIDAASSEGRDGDGLIEGLLRARDDAPETLGLAALATRPARWQRRVAVSCAILRHRERGVSPPDALVDALALEPDSASLTWIATDVHARLGERARRSLWARASAWRADELIARSLPASVLQRDALRALDPARRRALVARRLRDAYGIPAAAVFAAEVDDDALRDEVIEAVLKSSGEERDAVSLGLGALDAETLYAALSRAPRGPREREFALALVVSLARRAEHGLAWDAPLDLALRVDLVPSPWRWDPWSDVLAKALLSLPPLRAQAPVLAALDPTDPEQFSRAFRFVGALPTEGVLRRAFAGLVELPRALSSQQRRRLDDGLATLDDRRRWCAWALAAGVMGDARELVKTYAR